MTDLSENIENEELSSSAGSAGSSGSAGSAGSSGSAGSAGSSGSAGSAGSSGSAGTFGTTDSYGNHYNWGDKQSVAFATYTSHQKEMIRVWYYDFNDMQDDGTATVKQIAFSNFEFLPERKRIFDVYTDEELTENLNFLWQQDIDFMKTVEEFAQYKKLGITPESVTLSKIINMSAEDIFRLKIEMFEEETVQNASTENRSLLRKSESFIEMMYHYYKILEETSDESLLEQQS